MLSLATIECYLKSRSFKHSSISSWVHKSKFDQVFADIALLNIYLSSSTSFFSSMTSYSNSSDGITYSAYTAVALLSSSILSLQGSLASFAIWWIKIIPLGFKALWALQKKRGRSLTKWSTYLHKIRSSVLSLLEERNSSQLMFTIPSCLM